MDLLPTPEAGPEAAYARNVLLEELEDALHELPEEQREVFIAHELEGRALKNWLMPSIVGLNRISFWQAVGLMGLSWILFGGFRGGRIFSLSRKHSMRERWDKMTPEQRDKFRKGLQRRCGKVEPPTAEPEAGS